MRIDAPDLAATSVLGSALAALVEPGDLVLLEGDLGAGKTTFVQAVARALGVTEGVTSPTFTLMNIYPTAEFDLVHVDVYRLERLSEVVDLALPEMLDDGAVVFIEWGERAAAALGGERLHVRIEAGTHVSGRTFELTPCGERWVARLAALAAAEPS